MDHTLDYLRESLSNWIDKDETAYRLYHKLENNTYSSERDFANILDQEDIHYLSDRYEELTFLVHKRGEFLTNQEISDELTYDQHFTMRYIMKNDLCTSTDLAKNFYVKKSAITAIINRLVEKDFVRRDRDTKDRRVVYLKLTEKGIRFYEECHKKIHDVVARLISHFTEEEIDAFMNTYEKVAKVLEKAIVEREG